MSCCAPHILAAGRGGSLFGDVLPWALALIGIVVVGFIVLMYLRRSITSDSTGQSQGFTLQDLRDLHGSGQLSDEEFEQARAAMIGRLTAEKSDHAAENTAKKPGNASDSQNPSD